MRKFVSRGTASLAMIVGVLALLTFGWGAPAWATTLTVTNTNDSGEGSLRQKITEANDENANPGQDTIEFAPSLTANGPATITLSTVGDESFGPSALVVSSDVTIAGPSGEDGVAISRSSASGTPGFRLFYVKGTSSRLALMNLTLTGGLAKGGDGAYGNGGGGAAGGLGGAVFNEGTLDVIGSTLSGNTAQGGNGGSFGDPKADGGGGGGVGGAGQPGLADSNGTGAGGPPNGGSATDYDGVAGGYGGGGSGWWYGYLNLIEYSLGTGGFGGGGGGGTSSYPAVGDLRITPRSFSGFSGGFGGGGGGAGHGVTYDTDGQTSPWFGWGGKGGFGGGDGGGEGSPDGYYLAGCGGGGGAGLGGAVFNRGGEVSLTNTTLTGNAARGGSGSGGYLAPEGGDGSGFGGAVFNLNGSVVAEGSTLAGNAVSTGAGADGGAQTAGAGIYNLGAGAYVLDSEDPGTRAPADTGRVELASTIVADGVGADDFHAGTTNGGAVSSGGSDNLIEANALGDAGFSGGIASSADPKLGPLQDNGGPTPTRALAPDSLAVGRGNFSAFGGGTDQRGKPRPAGAPVGEGMDGSDIGAFEFQPPLAGPDSYSTDQSQPLHVAAAGVLANDERGDGGPLSAEKVSGPAHGQLQLTEDGSFTYTPESGYVGADSFSYRATDGTAVSDVATVAIAVEDTTKPTISAVSPRHGSITRDPTPTIRATVRDNTPLAKANAKLYVAGRQISASKYTYTPSTGALVYNSPKLSKGKKTVKIVATDAAGNALTKIWSFTIK